MDIKTLAGILAVVSAVLLASGAFYDFNGKSLDIRDREIRIVVSGSMDGDATDYEIETIPVNSLVMIEHLSQEELPDVTVGDVLSYLSDGIVIIHRVVENDPSEGRFVLKGDSNKSSETVAYEDVTGRVIGVSPSMGAVVSFVQANVVPLLVASLSIFGISWSANALRKRT